MVEQAELLQTINTRVEGVIRRLATLECELWGDLFARAADRHEEPRNGNACLESMARARAYVRHSRSNYAMPDGDLDGGGILRAMGFDASSLPSLNDKLCEAREAWAALQLERYVKEREVGVATLRSLGRVEQGESWTVYRDARRKAAGAVVELCSRQLRTQQDVLDFAARHFSVEERATLDSLLLRARFPELARAAGVAMIEEALQSVNGAEPNAVSSAQRGAVLAMLRVEFSQLCETHADAYDVDLRLESRGVDPEDPQCVERSNRSRDRVAEWRRRGVATLVGLGVLDDVDRVKFEQEASP